MNMNHMLVIPKQYHLESLTAAH